MNKYNLGTERINKLLDDICKDVMNNTRKEDYVSRVKTENKKAANKLKEVIALLESSDSSFTLRGVITNMQRKLYELENEEPYYKD